MKPFSQLTLEQQQVLILLPLPPDVVRGIQDQREEALIEARPEVLRLIRELKQRYSEVLSLYRSDGPVALRKDFDEADRRWRSEEIGEEEKAEWSIRRLACLAVQERKRLFKPRPLLGTREAALGKVEHLFRFVRPGAPRKPPTPEDVKKTAARLVKEAVARGDLGRYRPLRLRGPRPYPDRLVADLIAAFAEAKINATPAGIRERLAADPDPFELPIEILFSQRYQ